MDSPYGKSNTGHSEPSFGFHLSWLKLSSTAACVMPSLLGHFLTSQVDCPLSCSSPLFWLRVLFLAARPLRFDPVSVHHHHHHQNSKWNLLKHVRELFMPKNEGSLFLWSWSYMKSFELDRFIWKQNFLLNLDFHPSQYDNYKFFN